MFPHCLLLLTALPLDCYLTPTGLFCSPLSTASLRPSFVNWPSFFPWTFLSSSTSGKAGDFAVRLFEWVSRQSRQRDSLTGARTHTHTPTQHNEWPHSVTQVMDRKYMPFVFISPHVRFFMIFGDNVPLVKESCMPLSFMAWLSAVRSWPPVVGSLFGRGRNEWPLVVEGMNDQVD